MRTLTKALLLGVVRVWLYTWALVLTYSASMSRVAALGLLTVKELLVVLCVRTGVRKRWAWLH